MYRDLKKRRIKTICCLIVFLSSFAISCSTLPAQSSEGTQGQGMTNEAGEEIVKPAAGFSAVVRLTDAKRKTLLTQGSLRISVPNYMANSVRSVVIQRPIYFKEQRAVSYSDVELVAKQIQLEIGSEVLQRIDYQPIELKFYESGISSIVLKYVGGPLKPNDFSGVGDPAKDGPVVLVRLRSGKGIEGRLKGMAELTLESQFGNIQLSMAKASQITIQQADGVLVEMANGDSISGSIADKQVVVLNRWDDETIPLSDIRSIVVRRAAAIVRNPNGVSPVQPTTIYPPTIYPSAMQNYPYPFSDGIRQR